MVKSVKSVGKQLRLVEAPLHRGYVFVQMAMDRDLHDAVLAPNGASSLPCACIYLSTSIGLRLSAVSVRWNMHPPIHPHHMSPRVSFMHPPSVAVITPVLTMRIIHTHLHMQAWAALSGGASLGRASSPTPSGLKKRTDSRYLSIHSFGLVNLAF